MCGILGLQGEGRGHPEGQDQQEDPEHQEPVAPQQDDHVAEGVARTRRPLPSGREARHVRPEGAD